MIILYILAITLIVVILGSIIPILQVLISKKQAKTSYQYVFSNELINHKIKFKLEDGLFSRALLATRGWVRGPQGILMTNEAFEQKKKIEYEIELP